MRRETTDLIGSGLLLLALATATIATLAPTSGASVTPSGAVSYSADPTVERGHSLFFAKGCVGCHRMAVIAPSGPQIGPDLTSLELRAGTTRPGYTAEQYVRESLKDPGAFLAAPISQDYMPDLGLSDQEIEALTAFLLAPDP